MTISIYNYAKIIKYSETSCFLVLNGLLTEVREKYILGNQHFSTGQVYFGFVVHTLFFKLFQSDNKHICRQNDRLNGVAIYLTLEYPISLPVKDNKVSLSVCETLYKCSKLTIQNCHRGNPIWRYVSNLIRYITFLFFHHQEFHWWTL